MSDTAPKRGLAALKRHYAERNLRARAAADPTTLPEGQAERLGWELARDSMAWLRTLPADKRPRPLRPLVVQRGGATGEDILRRDFWPGWDFAVVLLHNDVQLSRATAGAPALLELDLDGQPWGLYSNLGKSFTRERYLPKADVDLRAQVQAHTTKLHELLVQQQAFEPTPCRFGDLPLRWASAGFLPIVKWRGRYWAAFFFRDIDPIGLNVANGGSERKEEYRNVRHLMSRESREELQVLAPPAAGEAAFAARWLQLCKRGVAVGTAEQREAADAARRDLLETHQQLRRDEDHLEISLPDPSRPLGVRIIGGNAHVSIRYTEKGTVETEPIEDVFLAVNCMEFGIECIQLGVLELPDDHLLLDGETFRDFREDSFKGKDVLVRRPVVLVSLNHLYHCWDTNRNRLGDPVAADGPEAARRVDCRVLPCLPDEAYHIFETDIALRERRLEAIEDDARREDERATLAHLRAAAEHRVHPHELIRTLCPVTWKVLELAFRHPDVLALVNEDRLAEAGGEPTHIWRMTRAFQGHRFSDYALWRERQSLPNLGFDPEPKTDAAQFTRARPRDSMTALCYLTHHEWALPDIRSECASAFIDRCEQDLACAYPALAGSSLWSDLQRLLGMARVQWGGAIDTGAEPELPGDWHGLQESVKRRLRGPLLEMLARAGLPAGRPASAPDWFTHGEPADYCLDLDLVAEHLRAVWRCFRDEHSCNPDACRAAASVRASRRRMALDLCLALHDSRGAARGPQSCDRIFDGGTLKSCADKLCSVARLGAVQRPDPDREPEWCSPDDAGKPRPEVWWYDASGPDPFFALVLEFPFPAPDRAFDYLRHGERVILGP
jgi:hypothetical protein